MERDSIESAMQAADALAAAGNNDGAIAKLREILKEHPEHAHILAMLAIFQIRANRPDEAIKAGEAAIAAAPGYDFGHRALGWALQQKDNDKRAETHFRTALELEPEGAYNHYAHALLMMKLNRRKEASEAMQRALAIDPENSTFLGAYAELRVGEGKLTPQRLVDYRDERVITAEIPTAPARGLFMEKVFYEAKDLRVR